MWRRGEQLHRIEWVTDQVWQAHGTNLLLILIMNSGQIPYIEIAWILRFGRGGYVRLSRGSIEFIVRSFQNVYRDKARVGAGRNQIGAQ